MKPQKSPGLSSSLLARLQDVEVHYADDDHQNPVLGEDPPRVSQSLQENQRTPATLHLGSSSNPRKKNPPRAVKKKPKQAWKVTKKIPAGKVVGVTKSRGISSLLEVARTTKQRATRGRPPARKKLRVEHKGQAQELPLNKDDGAPVMVNVAGTSRGRVDFRDPPYQIP